MKASILFSLLLIATSLLSANSMAQHATAFDVEDGKVVYGRLCANCHGPDGNLITNIDLGRGLYRRQYSDEELTEIILDGIKETPMPGNPTMSREQAVEVVAYLRTRAANRSALAITGNAENGRTLFFGKGDCDSCHRVDGAGSRLGPDLSNIAILRSSEELIDSLLNPANEVQPENRLYQVISGTGETVRGRLLNHDTFTLQLLDENEALRSFAKAQIRESGFLETNMPSARDILSDSEVADLVSWLATLRN